MVSKSLVGLVEISSTLFFYSGVSSPMFTSYVIIVFMFVDFAVIITHVYEMQGQFKIPCMEHLSSWVSLVRF